MPRVHFVKKARKDNPAVKRGESYYWWKFRYGGKCFSTTPPRPSQLTQSEYLGTFYDLQEQVEDIGEPITRDEIEEFADRLQEIADEIQTLGDEQSDKRDNMPYQLQDGEIGDLLEQRADACRTAYDELENVASELKGIYEDLDEDADDEKVEQACQEASGHLCGICIDAE